MRRTLLSILVAVATFAVTTAVLIGGFQLIAGSSEPPKQSSRTRTSDGGEMQEAAPSPSAAPDVSGSDGTPAGSSTGMFGGAGISLGVGPGALPEVEDLHPDPEPTAGVLSEDFRKLGLDDPTTKVDESVTSACDTLKPVPVAGHTLCEVVK